MAPLILVATAVFFFIQSATADPTAVVVTSVTPNRAFAGNETATVNGYVTFVGSGVTASNTITCTGALNGANPAPTGGAITGTGTATGNPSAAPTTPATFSVVVGTTYTAAGVSTPVTAGSYPISCTAQNGVVSTTQANLYLNPTTGNGGYSITASPDKTTVTTSSTTGSTVTLSGQFTTDGNGATITCARVSPPNEGLTTPPVTYTINGAAVQSSTFAATAAFTNPTNYTAAFDFSSQQMGTYTLRCVITSTAGPGTFRYGATAYTITVMPPQVISFGALQATPSTFIQPPNTQAQNGWTISGSVLFADNSTRFREIFCVSPGTTPQLIGQGLTTTVSTATRQDVDFSVVVGDIQSAAPNPLPTNGQATGNVATCTVSTTAPNTGDTSCTFLVGNNAALTTGAATNPTYTTDINDYGIQCYSGKVASGVNGATGRAVVDTAALASFRSSNAVASSVADIALTPPVDNTGPAINFVPGPGGTAPTVSTTNATTSVTFNGTVQGVTAATPRSVSCKTATSSPSQFTATSPVPTATSNTQVYTVTLPIPSNATSGLYSFRCLLNVAAGATQPPSFAAVTDRTVNVTVAGAPTTPTSSPTAPTPTVPTRTPTGSPTAPTPPTPTRPTSRPSPTPFPTKPRTPGPTGPVPSSCSKDDEYRAPGGCAPCISSSSPFKQVFGGSVCANPTTFSSKSTTCSTYTLQAFPRADSTSDKTAKCISQKSQVISILVVATPQSEVEFLSSSSYRKSSLRLGTLRGLSNRGLVVWVKKGNRQLIQFDDRFRTVRSQKGKTVKLTGTLRPYVGATLLRCFTAYLKVCDD